jgi:ketol-acid reductoisomerase
VCGVSEQKTTATIMVAQGIRQMSSRTTSGSPEYGKYPLAENPIDRETRKGRKLPIVSQRRNALV